MDKKTRIKSNRLLIVEGDDEVNFFKALLKQKNLNDFQVISVGGKDKFPTELPLLINLEGFSKVNTIGFVRDAEENKAQSAFSSICSQLRKNNLPVPNSINEVIEKSGVRVGIFIMPNNADEGMLEDLCIESIKNNAIYDCIEQYLECCYSKLPNEGNQIKTAKAKVLIYLATKNPIVNSLGVATQKGYWDLENACFNEIKNFIDKLTDQL